MKNVFLLYDNCCLYEIMILNYFMKFTGEEVIFTSLDGQAVRSMEGYSVNVDEILEEVNIKEIKSFIIPGGDVFPINNKKTHEYIVNLEKKEAVVAAICAGVDVLDNAGVLKNIKSTHSEDMDVVVCKNIITARANAYVDFAVEVAKKLELFKDEKDLQETIDFWKYHKRMQ